jgi:hypothetical protein
VAYLKIKEIGKGRHYYYIVRGMRDRITGKVHEKTLEYLGRDPDPKRLAAAMKYWKVGTKRKARKGGRG